MCADVSSQAAECAKFLEQMSPEERDKLSAEHLRQAESEYRQFVDFFQRGDCYICRDTLTAFNRKKPCIHWLLKPKGFKKKHFRVVTDHFGVFQIQSFLRWVANQQGFAKHINDLPAEGSETKLIELTIRYANLEWGFSCSASDFQGHGTTQHSKYPHYHFQMRVDQLPFINYSDFHVRLKEGEIMDISVKQLAPHIVKHKFPFGEGMGEILNDETVDNLIKNGGSSDLIDDPILQIDSLAMADEGTKIKGDDLYALIQEAKAGGVTVASLLHKLPNASTRIIVSPGSGVVEQAPRTSRRKNPE